MIQTALEAILQKLQADFAGLSVEPFPDDPANYRLKHAKGAILVRYDGAQFAPGFGEMGQFTAADYLAQPQSMRPVFVVDLLVRSLRGNQGAYALLDEIRGSLIGFRPGEFLELTPLGEGFDEMKEGVWRYRITFQTTN